MRTTSRGARRAPSPGTAAIGLVASDMAISEAADRAHDDMADLRFGSPGFPVGLGSSSYPSHLERPNATPHSPQHGRGAHARRLDEQLARMRQLCDYGEYDWGDFLVKRAEIHAAQQSLPDEASVTPQDGDLEWCRAQ